MFERTRVCLGGLVWKQKRFNQLRKRRAREYQNRVFNVEVSILWWFRGGVLTRNNLSNWLEINFIIFWMIIIIWNGKYEITTIIIGIISTIIPDDDDEYLLLFEQQ